MDSSLGMGYGTTLTPLLMLAGYAPLEIVPAVLFSELLTGMLAVAMHQRDGNVDFLNNAQARKTAFFLVSLSSIGGVLAVWVAISLPRFWLSLFITLIILAMGVIILLTRAHKIQYRKSSIMAVGALALVFELSTRRSVMQETLAAASLSDEIRRAGLSGIPVEVIAVFTSKEARLTGVSAQKCFDRDGMIAYLEQERFHSGPVEDTHETGVKLKSLVTVYKSEKNKKKKK